MNPNKFPKLFLRSIPYVTIFLVLGALVLRALELRLPGITQNFSGDPMQHNFSVIHPTHLKWMLELLYPMYQPFLDFFLRKYFWVMLFGHNEITLRLPNLIYSLITVAFCCIGPFYYLKTKKLPGFYILFASIITALFALNNSTEIFVATYARHYSFTSLASVLWVFVFLFYEKESKNYLLALVSFLFMNIHFFSMPLILGGYGYLILKSLIERKYQETLFSVSVVIIVFAVTLGINYQAFFEMFYRPVGGASIGLRESISLGLQKYSIFMNGYLSLFLPTTVLFLINLFFIQRQENQKIILLTFLIIPLFLIYVSKRSNYGFGMRYYTSFFGVGLGLLTLFFYNAYTILERLRFFIRKERTWVLIRNTLAGVLVGSFFFVLNGHHLPADLFKDRKVLKLPPKNFSEYYRIYQELKQSQVPLFIINPDDWRDFTIYLYMRWMGTAGFNRGYDFGFELVHANEKGMHPISIETAKKRLKRFIEMNPKGKIILDNKEKPFLDPSVLEHPLIREKVKRITCCKKQVWILSDITSANQVYRIARILKFPGKMFQKEIKTE